MGDNDKAVSFDAGSGQNQAANSAQPTAPQTVTPQSGGTTPEYVTREEVNELLKETLDQANRQAQGWTDKLASRIDARVNQIAKDYQTVTGMAPTQAVMDRAKQVATAEAQQSGQSSPQNQEQPDQAKPSGSEGDPAMADVQAKTVEIYQRLVVVEPDDPEAKLVDYSNEQAFLVSLEKAAQAKKDRISSPQTPGQPGAQQATPQQAPVDPNNQANAGAGFQFVGGNGAANAVQATNDLEQLWTIAKQQGRI